MRHLRRRFVKRARAPTGRTGLRGRQDAPIDLTIDRLFTDPENPAVGDFVSVGFELTNAPAASDDFGRFYMLVESPQFDQSILHFCTTIDPGESGEFGPAAPGIFLDIDIPIPEEDSEQTASSEEMADSEPAETESEPVEQDPIDQSLQDDDPVGDVGDIGDIGDVGDIEGPDQDALGEIDIDSIDIPDIGDINPGLFAPGAAADGVQTRQDDLGGSFRMPSEEVTLVGRVGPIHDLHCLDAPSSVPADDTATITVSPSLEGVAEGVSLAGPCRASTTELRRNASLTVEQDVQNTESAPVQATVQWVFPNSAIDETATIPANSTGTVSLTLNTLNNQALALEPLPADMTPRTELIEAVFA